MSPAQQRGVDGPFFLAVGFYKPHLPFASPARHWNPPTEQPAAPSTTAPPEGSPREAIHDSHELRSFHDIPDEGPIPSETQARLLQGYRACVSYVDAQIGRLLDELERLELADDTIVVVWGDHGWHLGEHGMWGKNTSFEVATRVPLILRVPGHDAAHCSALVESVDLYPTLCELSGIPRPSHLEGDSLAPLLEDPTRPFKTRVFSETHRGRRAGHSIRSPSHRLTTWTKRGEKEPFAVELYAIEDDLLERRNIAPEHPDRVRRMRRQLAAGWRAARPTSAAGSR